MVAYIMLVDDEITYLQMIEMMLSKAGYKTIACKSGTEALHYAKTKDAHIEAILLDVMMPDMDGIEVLQELKKIPAWKDIPVIMQSGMADGLDKEHALKEGAEAYLCKPYTARELIDLIAQVMRKKSI